ncbi:unnamed protein product [Effrenium voratum]|uniref:Peptidase M50 domain-containing protein n=1 Tax=Effrenium voratum TaxID=2562239 RepID=A0AA36J0C5_9DINO|nr:unnamed protein product [Effrenium voratum]
MPVSLLYYKDPSLGLTPHVRSPCAKVVAAMQGLGATGAAQSKDCSFPAGSVAGAPLRVSWFLVILFLSQLVDAVNQHQWPLWVRLAFVTGNELLLLGTVLCHEMGHGTMARRCGGTIAEVLLWPFGGICFTTRAQGRGPREKLVDDLYIVAAGPATHFPQSGVWLALLAAFAAAMSHVQMPPAWKYLVPFGAVPSPCLDANWPGPGRPERVEPPAPDPSTRRPVGAMLGEEELICTGCKDPYHSSTGCLCAPGEENWVPKEPKPEKVEKEKKEARAATPRCSCGEMRVRASKAPDRLLPCDCGAEACDAP